MPDIRDFGASADDATSALRAAVSAPNSAVWIPPGNWHIRDTVTISSAASILGAGKTISRLVFHHDRTSSCFLIDAASNVQFNGLQLSKHPDSVAHIGSAISVINGNGIQVDDCRFLDWSDLSLSSTAIDIAGRQFFQMSRCRLIADRPVVILDNGALPTIDADFFSLRESSFLITAQTSHAIHAEENTTAFNAHLSDCSINQGAGILRMDAGAAESSSQLRLQNVRAEQLTDVSQHQIDITSNAQVQLLHLDQVRFANDAPALRLERVMQVICDSILHFPATTMSTITIDGNVAPLIDIRGALLSSYSTLHDPAGLVSGPAWPSQYGVWSPSLA